MRDGGKVIDMYDSYVRYVYDFLQDHWSDISATLEGVNELISLVSMLLQAVVFFGLLFFGFKFIKARWLTVC